MLQNLVTIGSMEGRSPTGYSVPAFFSRILHVLPQCIPAFSTPVFYTYSVPHSRILSTAVATFTARRKHSPTTIFTAMIKYFTAFIKYSMYACTCTLLLTYPPHPNPSFVLGVPLRSSVFPAVYMCTRCAHGVAGGLGGGSPQKEKRSYLYDRIYMGLYGVIWGYMSHPTPFRFTAYYF